MNNQEASYPLPNTLAAAKLINDPRVVQAKKLLGEALTEHSHRLTGVRPPQQQLVQQYEEMIAAIGEYRGGKLWFPYLGSGIGHGPLVELADGSVKYDLIAGIGPHIFGHSHPKLLDIVVDAALSNTIMQGNLQQNVDSLELCALLVKTSGLPHCFLSSSGAMAVENALKIAFQKKHPATRILAFDHCFAGRSLTSSQITDKPGFREGLPINVFVDYVPFFDADAPRESTDRALHTIKTYLSRYPKQHALMLFELVQGEGGFYTATREFFVEIMSLLKQHDVAILADEVQSFARTTQLFAYQLYKLEEFVDIVTIGKVSQVCATLFTDHYKPKPGLLSQTFTGSTSSIKAASAIIKELLHGGYYGPNGKIDQIHNYFVEKLKRIAIRKPTMIKGPYGIGSMVAFTPYEGDSQQVNTFVHRLFHAGVMSFVAGSHPTRVRFLLPVGAITQQDIDRVAEIIEQTLVG